VLRGGEGGEGCVFFQKKKNPPPRREGTKDPRSSRKKLDERGRSESKTTEWKKRGDTGKGREGGGRT